MNEERESKDRRTASRTADPAVRKLLPRYLERRRAEIRSLEKAAQKCDFKLIEITGHNLAGSGDAYGLSEITTLGHRLSDGAVQRDIKEVVRAIVDLRRFLDTVETE